MESQPNTNLEEMKAEIERLQALLERKSQKKPNVEFLGEVLSADVLAELSAGGKLSAVGSRNAKPGLHGDGRGLWLQVTPGGRSWVFRHRVGAKQYEVGLGPLTAVTLGDARARAAICRRLVQQGVDLIARKRALAVKNASKAATIVTFRDAAEKYIAAKKAGWKSPKHEAQWTASLEHYAYPLIGSVPVRDVDTSLVMQVLEQTVKTATGDKTLWEGRPETAGRVRGRMESILDWAKVRTHRQGENPARWRGHLQHQLAPQNKVRKVKHHAALPYDEMFDFFKDLEKRSGKSADCLKFTILTAARSGEAIGARWSEIDLKNRLWTVPGERAKTGKDHRVPLTGAAVDALKGMIELKVSDEGFLFPGATRGRGLSNMAMAELLKELRPGITVHGFRSTFRDWAAETTNYANEVVEMALAHAVGSKVEAAYRRGDMFERRRRLMDDWSSHCHVAPVSGGNVHKIGVAQ